MTSQKTVYLDLPPRMTARKLKTGKVLYYYQANRRKIPLGADLKQARVKWAALENSSEGGDSFKAVALKYRKEQLPKKAHKTQIEQSRQIQTLIDAFGHASLEEIEPKLIQQYLVQRSAPVAANREISLFSEIFNWARRNGITSANNPCLGTKRNKEKARGVYVDDAMYKAVYDKAEDFVKDAMDLALLTSQRPSDVLNMKRSDIKDGYLWVRPRKTRGSSNILLRIEVTGMLKTVIDRITSKDRPVQSMYLICDKVGQKIAIRRFWLWFKRTGATWQFRDLRAKAVTDETDISVASKRAGHSNETITAEVYRRVKGNTVKPLK